ncbi:MAG TPA: hypothetical protein VJT69_17995 [Pyrinomonadaceae bacterium]|nr:hypothetical protein [Pyrinomonadaceae bacterium]
MSEHLSQTQLAGYSGRTLDPDELLAVDRHLASCDVCNQRLLRSLPGIAKVSQSFEFEGAPFHLDYVQHLQPYVDGKANDIDREIVDSHVTLCSNCATELEDLLAFKQHRPVAAITGNAVTSSRWLGRWTFLPSPALATAVVIAVFILAMAVLLWTTYPRSERVERATAGPSPETEKPTPGPETARPSPAPTEQTARTITPSNSHENKAALPIRPREESLVVLNDAGGQLTVNPRGRLEGLPELPPDLRESVEKALATRRLHASPALTEWSTGAGNLRSEVEKQSTFAPLDPTDVVIQTDRPTFRWRALEAASHYIVAVYDSRLRQVGSSGPVTGTEWTMPHALERGVTYSWQISALRDGKTVVSPKPPLPEARFKILDQPAVETLAKLKESAGSSHLIMGVFYWKHGLIEESEREFQLLAKANPKSTAVKELLASIRSIRRR